MRTHTMMLTATLLTLAGACSRGSDARPDDALKTDLALAAQVQPFQAQQFVSPTEQQFGAPAMAPQYLAGRTPQPVTRAPVYRAPARRASSRSSGRASSSSGTYYPAERRVVKHGGRDAAIGAGAGAVIGVMTSRDKVKGGLIGAAAGGILGAVIGNNVDVQRP